MKKINLGQTLNTIANLGVIGGIVFLALEMSQTQDLARAQTRTEILLSEQEVIRLRIEGPVLDIIEREYNGEAVTGADEGRLVLFGIMANDLLNHQAYLTSQGLYEIDQLEENLARTLLVIPGRSGQSRDFCRRWPDGFSPTLVSVAEPSRERIEELCE